MNENLKQEIENLKYNLKEIAAELCNTHKLASTLDKFCKDNINNDDLYEVSYLAELLEKQLSKLGFDFYITLNENNKSKTMDDVLDRIRDLKATEHIDIIDD